MKQTDFLGNGNYKSNEEYDIITIDDVYYDNNPEINVSIILKDGDSFEYIREMISRRKKLPSFEERSPRDIKMKKNVIEAIVKIKDKESMYKKLKTLIKFSADEDFHYRKVIDIFKSKDFLNFVEFDKEKEMNEKYLKDLIITESINSLEEYSMIHPKIRLLINECASLSKKSDIFGLNFTLSEKE